MIMNINLEAVVIDEYKEKYHDEVYALLLSILETEFKDTPADNFLSDISDIPQVYASPKGNFWVALYKDKVIGTVACIEDDEKKLLMRRFFVNPNYRSRGIGKLLLSNVIDFARQNNYDAILFSGNTKMQQAKYFLAKENFREVENIPLAVVNIFRMSYSLKKREKN